MKLVFISDNTARGPMYTANLVRIGAHDTSNQTAQRSLTLCRVRIVNCVITNEDLRVVYYPVGGLPFTKNKHSDMPKADESYTPAPAMVHVNKPAHTREGAITDKTGGCNSKASVWERTRFDVPQGTRGCEK